MRASIRVLPLLLAAAVPAACTGEDDESVRKDIAAMRGDLQRAQKDNEKLSTRLAAMERRLGGVSEDLGQVRQLAIDVKPAAAAGSGAAAAAAGATAESAATAGASTGVYSAAEGIAIRQFLGTDDGRKVLAAAVQADRDARDNERARRAVDMRVDRFAKEAGLTADQTQKMKDILGRQADAMRGVFANLRDLPPNASAEERAAVRQQDSARMETLRKQVDDQLRAVLSQTQYDQYQQSAKQRGANSGVPGNAGNNVRRNRNNGGAQTGN